MPKTKLSDIFKNGENFQCRKFDSLEFDKICESVEKENKRIKDFKNINPKLFWKKINK